MQDQTGDLSLGMSEEDILMHVRWEKFQSITVGTLGSDEFCCICQVKPTRLDLFKRFINIRILGAGLCTHVHLSDDFVQKGFSAFSFFSTLI